ncbi:pentapeptide repeat-containing protein [Ruegeria sp. HKCCD7319]|uniref:pentapeptide repeat-containing protein n=1 Tax=unclassified Ruegeria TaxID=2625375 RepID=UPI0035302ED6
MSSLSGSSRSGSSLSGSSCSGSSLSGSSCSGSSLSGSSCCGSGLSGSLCPEVDGLDAGVASTVSVLSRRCGGASRGSALFGLTRRMGAASPAQPSTLTCNGGNRPS